jgi:hypothetical protein
MAMDDKLIVTNRAALEEKYGKAGLARIKSAVDALIAADAARDIKSRLVYLDDAVAMKRYKAKPVKICTNPRQNKDAIDAIFRSDNPEYLLILGAPDVVPHQNLSNPVYDPENDDDKYAWGDLPYACDAPYAQDIAKFKGPTRVVGRLPDMVGPEAPDGSMKPDHILSLLGTAAKYKRRKATEYGTYFGLSTHSWQKSTDLSLFNIFGNSDAIAISPKDGPAFPARRLAPLTHFINCHGARLTPEFYGEKGQRQPVSYKSLSIAKKIRPGTVAAMECCYGAELYDSDSLEGPLPICQHYLKQGAYGYFGSTTIAYGPPSGNGAADLITQFFLLAVIGGASLGRAALQARQRFIEEVSELDPVDLKTLGQFNLLGDPSIHPVASEDATDMPKNVDAKFAASQGRRERRAKMKEMGEHLAQTKPTASRRATSVRKSKSVRDALASLKRKAGISAKKEFIPYTVKAPPAARARARARNAKGGAALATRYYVLSTRKKTADPARDLHKAVVAKEVSGRIVGFRIYEAK